MFLGLPDPDPLVRDMDPDPSTIKHQAKIVRKTFILIRKTFIPHAFLLLYDFLSLKNDVNVASKSKKTKNLVKKKMVFSRIAGSESGSVCHR
jgi:hypothetical protein